MGARRRVFPGAFKREAVERVASSGLFTSQVAQELGPHETVLRRWVRDLAPQATEPARHPIPQAAAPSPVDLAAENARLRRENERLRMERDISKKGLAHLRSSLPMKFGFDDEHRAVWPVRVMCAALGLSASGHCAWRARPESLRAQANRALTDDIRLIHAESSGTYGAPRIHAVLRGHGRRVGRSRIERLMRRAGTQIYFCDPQSPWQHGTNENTNGLLRQYFPKGTDLSAHSAETIAAVPATLNARPQKALGWKSPAEALDQ